MEARGKAIIVGCRQGGLAVARSLSKYGIKTLVLSYDSEEPGLKSKYVKEWHLCPSPADEEAFIENLLSYADEWEGALLMTAYDYSAVPLSRNKDKLSQHFHVAVPDWEHAKIFLEKDETYRLAEELGIPHPKISEPKTMAELDTMIEDMQLPIMIKPVHSHAFVAVFGKKLFINDTVEELRSNFQRVLDANQEVVISEIIPGSDYKTLETVQIYIDQQDEVNAIFCCIKYRQMPPMYGVIRAGTSMPRKDDLVESGLKLLQSINYRGYASIEFKRDPRDNQLKLIEVNIRALRMSQLPIASGIDFPYLAFQDLVLNQPVHVEEYIEEMNYVELAADIAGILLYDDEKNLSKFIQPYMSKHKTFPYLQFSDPMPILYEIRVRLGELVNKISNRFSKQN